MTTHPVNKVLYLVLNRENSVVPVQVVKVITEKTLSGETVSYVVQYGPDKKQSILSEMSAEVFDSWQGARDTLIQRVTVAVTSLIDKAVSKAREWYDEPESIEPSSPTVDVVFDSPKPTKKKKEHRDEEPVVVKLSDGTTARVKMPE